MGYKTLILSFFHNYYIICFSPSQCEGDFFRYDFCMVKGKKTNTMYYYIIRQSMKIDEQEKIEIEGRYATEREAISNLLNLGANLFGFRSYDELRDSHQPYDWFSDCIDDEGRVLDTDWLDGDCEWADMVKDYITHRLMVVSSKW